MFRSEWRARKTPRWARLSEEWGERMCGVRPESHSGAQGGPFHAGRGANPGETVVGPRATDIYKMGWDYRNTRDSEGEGSQ